MTSKLPVDFYPCLGSSILAQTSPTQVDNVNPVNMEGMKQLIMVSNRWLCSPSWFCITFRLHFTTNLAHIELALLCPSVKFFKPKN